MNNTNNDITTEEIVSSNTAMEENESNDTTIGENVSNNTEIKENTSNNLTTKEGTNNNKVIEESACIKKSNDSKNNLISEVYSKKSKPLSNVKALLMILVLVIVDQVSKLFVLSCLKGKEPIKLLGDNFEFMYLENRSAAFGVDPVSLFQSIFKLDYFYKNPLAFENTKFVFFVFFTVVIVGLIVYFMLNIPENSRYNFIKIVFSLIVAGAIGNFIDRVFRKFVVDFLYFKTINFPVFNIADIFITVGAIVLCILFLFYHSEEELGKIFTLKRKQLK